MMRCLRSLRECFAVLSSSLRGTDTYPRLSGKDFMLEAIDILKGVSAP